MGNQIYITYIYWERRGLEDISWKSHENLEKAIAYAHRYLNHFNFVQCEVLDEENNLVYALDWQGNITDSRQEKSYA